MILDANLRVSNAQQVTADAVSTNTVDHGNTTPKRNVGTGEPVGYGVFITAVGTQTGSAILSLIQSANADLSSPDKINSRALATADLALGKAYFFDMPSGAPTKRYSGLDYDITGTVDFTVSAYLMPRSFFDELSKLYAKGYTIS